MIAVVVTVAMAIDRLVVGAHWLTDVVASVALALVVAAVVLSVYFLVAGLCGTVGEARHVRRVAPAQRDDAGCGTRRADPETRPDVTEAIEGMGEACAGCRPDC